MATLIPLTKSWPEWLPDTAKVYLSYTRDGVSLRRLAEQQGCHPSTVLRQVRRVENRRDDPLVDEALDRLGRTTLDSDPTALEKENPAMTAPLRHCKPEFAQSPDLQTIDARRILRRLTEVGAVLAIAPDLDKAVVLREDAEGRAVRTAILDRPMAEAFALQDWIACVKPGRVATYAITATGRAALRQMIQIDGDAEDAKDPGLQSQGVAREDRIGQEPAKTRYNAPESPVVTLARRRDREGKPFLENDLVIAAERLREDFEIAQMGPKTTQNWDTFLTGSTRGSGARDGDATGPRAARERVGAALRDLGPGLGDMVLRCCCFLEGLEAAERRLGWSARSGKIVLRIGLQRLHRHYAETGYPRPLIG